MFEEVINKKKHTELARQQALSAWWEEDEDIGDSDFFWLLSERKLLKTPNWKLRLWKVYKPLLESEEVNKRVSEGTVFIDKNSGIEIPLEEIITEIESAEMKERREEAQERIKKNEIDYWKSVAENAWKLSEESGNLIQEEKDKIQKIKDVVCGECEHRISLIEGHETFGDE